MENALGIELYDRSGGSLGISGKGTLNQCYDKHLGINQNIY